MWHYRWKTITKTGHKNMIISRFERNSSCTKGLKTQKMDISCIIEGKKNMPWGEWKDWYIHWILLYPFLNKSWSSLKFLKAIVAGSSLSLSKKTIVRLCPTPWRFLTRLLMVLVQNVEWTIWIFFYLCKHWYSSLSLTDLFMTVLLQITKRWLVRSSNVNIYVSYSIYKK